MRHSKERVRKYGEVFTPEWLVKRMCDQVPTDYYDATHTFLEPSCGTGNFIVEVLTRKMSCIADISNKKKYAYYALKVLSSVYGVELLHDNIIECRKRVYSHWKSLLNFETQDKALLASAKAIVKTNLIWGDFIKQVNLKIEQPLSFVWYDWNDESRQVTLRSCRMEDMQNTISFNIPSILLGTCHYRDVSSCLML